MPLRRKRANVFETSKLVKCQKSLNLTNLIEYVSNVRDEIINNRFCSSLHFNTAVNMIPALDYLIDLNNMIGMNKIKQAITNLVLYICENLTQPDEYYHSIITGPPGTGKTTLISIMANIFSSLNICHTNNVVYTKASELISQYIGDTAKTTQSVLESALGGVLVIDEAYQLASHKNGENTHALECINTLNQFLSEHRGDFICFLAGYKDKIENELMSMNPGLKSRFPYIFEIEKYTADDLFEIFRVQANKNGWDVGNECRQLIRDNYHKFKYYGRDMELLFKACKIELAKLSWETNCVYAKLINEFLLNRTLKSYIVDDEIPEHLRLLFI